MKRCITCLIACLTLILSMAFHPPAAMAAINEAAFSLLPEDSIAVFISPEDNNQPRIIYAIYGITKDDEALSLSVRQISTDPRLTIYKEDVANMDEQAIRLENAFTSDQPIVGSYCSVQIEKIPDGNEAWDKWCSPSEGKIVPHGYYMDETFFFPLDQLEGSDNSLTLRISYNCITAPGTLYSLPLCLFTLDIADYLNPVTMPALSRLDTALLPEDTIAVLSSPPDNDHPAVIYAIHGISKDDETMSVGIRQISTDPQLLIYEEDVDNVDEQNIRYANEFSADDPIIGSYCEAVVENDRSSEDIRGRWFYYQQNSCMRHGYYMDETFLFLLSELGNIDEKIILDLNYNCIPIPATLGGHNLCHMTIDIVDYLK